MPKVTNRRFRTTSRPPEGTVYVGRPSKWGNPYMVGIHGTREQCVAAYKRDLKRNRKLLADLQELRGKDLECWCAPMPCHADVLLKMANK